MQANALSSLSAPIVPAEKIENPRNREDLKGTSFSKLLDTAATKTDRGKSEFASKPSRKNDVLTKEPESPNATADYAAVDTVPVIFDVKSEETIVSETAQEITAIEEITFSDNTHSGILTIVDGVPELIIGEPTLAYEPANPDAPALSAEWEAPVEATAAPVETVTDMPAELPAMQDQETGNEIVAVFLK